MGFVATCNECPWLETWSTRPAAEAACVWHVFNVHPEIWLAINGPQPPQVTTPPEGYGYRLPNNTRVGEWGSD